MRIPLIVVGLLAVCATLLFFVGDVWVVEEAERPVAVDIAPEERERILQDCPACPDPMFTEENLKEMCPKQDPTSEDLIRLCPDPTEEELAAMCSLREEPEKQKRRLVFVASHGHSGTMYMADVMRKFKNVTAFHERKPGPGIGEARRQGYEASYDLRMEKVRAIVEDIEETLEEFENPYQIYCDSTHQFLLSWPDVITDYFHRDHGDDYDLSVIVLRREAALTVRSHHHHPEYAPRKLPLYRMLESIPRETMEAAGIDEHMDDAISYLVDVELRLEWYRRQYPDVKIVEVRLEELESYDGVRYLGQMLGFEYDMEKGKKRIGLKENSHMAKDDLPVVGVRRALAAWMAMYESEEVYLPPIPATMCLSECQMDDEE